MKSIFPAMWLRFRRLDRLNAMIVAFCLVVVALVWSAVRVQARFEHQQTIDAAINQNSNLAIAFEQYTIRTIDGADAITQVLKHEYARSGRKINIRKLIAEHTINSDLFTAVSIADEYGNVIASSYAPPSTLHINISDRTHFTTHMQSDTDRVYVGKPVLSRTFGRPSIAITRRINKPDGSFGGIVAVQMEPRHFIKFLGETVLHVNDVVSLIGRDGIARARRVGAIESCGEDFHHNMWFAEQEKYSVGNYKVPARLDGITRLFSFRRLKNYPLVTIVGVAETDVLEKFRAREARYYLSATLVTLLILTFGGVIISVRNRRQHTLVLLLDSEKRLKALFDHSGDAILLTDGNAHFIDANPAACGLLGYTREEILQRGQWEITPPSELLAAREQWREFLAHGRQSGEYYIQRKDGVVVEIEYNAVADIEPGVHLSIFREITARRQAQEDVRRLGEQHLGLQRLLTHRFITTLEEERRAISFELHDGLTQYVMSSFAFFDSYSASLAHPNTPLPVDLQKGMKYLQEAVVEARRMVNGLRSLALDELGLVGALEQLLIEEQERARWQEAPLIVPTPIPRFDTVLETAAYRVVQEALTNIRKHAEARRVLVRLQVSSEGEGGLDRLQVEVRDWGKGFTVEEKREGYDHVGLHSMEERVNLLRGTILIESHPGEGTRVYAEFPIERRPAAPPPLT